jgi:thiol-disulfide isomerase/thioredoxin
MVGAEAPDFELTMLDGEIFRLSEQRGKVVLINIWATWCPPCVAEMPDIDRLAADYADELVVIGVNCGEPEQTIADFIAANGYTYNFAADRSYLVSGMLYPTMSIPYTIVVNADGVITQLHTGGGMGMYDVLKGYVEDVKEHSEEIEVALNQVALLDMDVLNDTLKETLKAIQAVDWEMLNENIDSVDWAKLSKQLSELDIKAINEAIDGLDTEELTTALENLNNGVDKLKRQWKH